MRSLDAFLAIVRRDLLLAMRRRSDVLNTLVFFVIVVSLFPLGVGPEPQVLREIAPGVVWVAALLASMLALGRLFAGDHVDGTLEQLLLAPQPLGLLVGGKLLAHWLTTGLPLVLATPLLALFLNLDAAATAAVMLTLLVGTPALTFTGLIGAALAVALRRGGLLLPVLVLPLTVPVLIFGVAASNAAIVGPTPFGTPFTLLCALTLLSLVIGPFAAAATLRHGLE
jgi:heme exporter protein B